MASLNIALSFKKIPLLIEETRDLADEKIRLAELDEAPEEADDIAENLKAIVKQFNYIDSELVYNLKQYLKDKPVLQRNLSAYDELIDFLAANSDRIPIRELDGYRTKELQCLRQEQVQAETGQGAQTVLKAKKSVRFKESLIDPPSSTSQLSLPQDTQRQSLFQQSSDSQLGDDHSTASQEELSNRQLFINNQQELLQQDSMLESLSGSIRTQREMGLSINEEVEDHMIILNDLERMIDGTGDKMARGRKNLARVNTKIRENGNVVTILVLLFILIFLVVVL